MNITRERKQKEPDMFIHSLRSQSHSKSMYIYKPTYVFGNHTTRHSAIKASMYYCSAVVLLYSRASSRAILLRLLAIRPYAILIVYAAASIRLYGSYQVAYHFQQTFDFEEQNKD
uniref:Uncharacterized protein n=1 Tax=Glossina austeni TaxID=7395 RepID=A0A1A9V0N5_GLOAU